MHVGLLGPGHLLGVGGGDHRLAIAGAQQLDQRLTPADVELGHDVVEQHQRRRLTAIGERLSLGQQPAQQRHPLLALRPVVAQLTAGP